MRTRIKSGLILGSIFMLMVTPIALIADSELSDTLFGMIFTLIRGFSPVNFLGFLICRESTPVNLNFGMYISFFLFGLILGGIMNFLPTLSLKYVLKAALSFVIAVVIILMFMLYFADKGPCDFSFGQACCASKNK